MSNVHFTPGEGENTRIDYLYRDADNYKSPHSVVLAGRITQEQIELISSTLSGSEFFLPDQVGLPSMTGQFEHGGGWDDVSDHPWHELGEITHTNDAAEYSLEDLMNAWPKSDDQWDGIASEEALKKSMPHI